MKYFQKQIATCKGRKCIDKEKDLIKSDKEGLLESTWDNELCEESDCKVNKIIVTRGERMPLSMNELDETNKEQLVIMQIMLCTSQSNYEALDESHEKMNRSLRNLGLQHADYIEKLQDEIESLKTKLVTQKETVKTKEDEQLGEEKENEEDTRKLEELIKEELGVGIAQDC